MNGNKRSPKKCQGVAAEKESEKMDPKDGEPESIQIEKPYIHATGLEDYSRWKTRFKDHNGENDPPFRRGRIWA